MYIGVVRTRNVHMPERGHAHDAGMDFYIPEFDEEFVKHFKSLSQNEGIDINSERIHLDPGRGAMIPSGVKTEIPIGYMGIFLNKSGVATKKRVLVGAQVVDCGYDGEVHINLHNVSGRPIEFKPGDKAVQMVLVPVVSATPIEVEKDSLYEGMRNDAIQLRAADGFGSTGENKKY
jgi:dUTP pyrophosphatase